MLEQLFGGLIDKEKVAYDAIKNTLEEVAEEFKQKGLPCSPDDFIIGIKPTDHKFNFKCFIMKATPNFVASVPATIVREITIKEIIGGDE